MNIKYTNENLEGKKFNYLTFLCIVNRIDGQLYCKWKCDCGKEIIVDSYNLRKGNSRSCGCLSKEIRTKHGHAQSGNKKPSSEYSAWCSMHQRCYNVFNKHYIDYGGRGIFICSRWHKDNTQGFQNFLKDLGYKPSNKYSLERML